MFSWFFMWLVPMLDPIFLNQQPEEQHGILAHYRLEEHLTTANVVTDKLLRINTHIWILILDPSESFERSGDRSVTMASHNIGFGQQRLYSRAHCTLRNTTSMIWAVSPFPWGRSINTGAILLTHRAGKAMRPGRTPWHPPSPAFGGRG